jgi:hypothetical protein
MPSEPFRPVGEMMTETTIAAQTAPDTSVSPEVCDVAMDDAIHEIARVSPELDRSAILQPDANGRFDLSIVLIPGFALGDLARVVDTLTTANSIAGKPLFQLQTIGLMRGPVPSASNIDVNPARCLADGPAARNILILAEVLAIDGPAGDIAEMAELAAWLR